MYQYDDINDFPPNSFASCVKWNSRRLCQFQYWLNLAKRKLRHYHNSSSSTSLREFNTLTEIIHVWNGFSIEMGICAAEIRNIIGPFCFSRFLDIKDKTHRKRFSVEPKRESIFVERFALTTFIIVTRRAFFPPHNRTAQCTQPQPSWR